MRLSVVPLFLVLASSLPAQEPLRVSVDLTGVSFAARDAGGGAVENLAQEDLEVFEDTVPQKISFFAKSTDVPLTIGLVVDASGSQESFGKKHHHDLEVFLRDVLGPRDRAFLVCFGNYLRLVSDFTQSGPQMLEALKKYEKKPEQFPEIGPREDRDLGTAFYDSIFYSVEAKLRESEGRRALLVFSDGEDNSSSHDMMTAIEAAQSANVVVYTLRYSEGHRGQPTARNRYGTRVMERIARETGGTAIDARATDPQAYFAQIARELRTSYELAYYPKNRERDGTFRKILIKPRRAGVTIRAKTGYFARLP